MNSFNFIVSSTSTCGEKSVSFLIIWFRGIYPHLLYSFKTFYVSTTHYLFHMALSKVLF
ncbi:hypothetical protein [Spiroplasma endosymbiont of Virgichneumon dumeticola]|uniref:hypothetical protein n=1 Tax=Spiroplasma endosymbiont of Virgichneumon dumeticola TaxID=3139323 RepID=UPI0035C8BCA9